MSEMTALRRALINLGAMTNRSLSNRDLDIWEQELSIWPEPEVLSAIRKVGQDPTKRLPVLADITSRLKAIAGPSGSTENLGWYGSQGDWGGNWANVPHWKWLMVGSMFYELEIRPNAPHLHRESRREFIAKATAMFGIERLKDGAELIKNGDTSKESFDSLARSVAA